MTGIHFVDAKGPEGMRIFAIGDVHGRADLLEALLDRIEAESEDADDWRVILLGDYVDRGPDSKGVLDLIIRRRKVDPRVIALRGNHDDGFLTFLRAPTKHSLFALHGGLETARSYGVEANFRSEDSAIATRDKLLEAVPTGHIGFLGRLPYSVAFGDFFFCHAGIRPGIALDSQDLDDLIWIREEFLDWPGLHPKVIVHGHTPQPQPEVLANRVNVDTLAYRSGELSALSILGNEKQLLSVTGSQ